MLKKANVVVLLLVQIYFLININFAFAYRNQDVLAASSMFKKSLDIQDLIKTSKIRYAQDHGIIKTVKSMDEYNKLQNQGYSLTPNGYLERGLKGGEESFKGEKLLSFQAHKGEVTHIKTLTPELLLTAGTDRKLKIWNLKQGICQKEIEYGESLIKNILKLKDNTIVTTHQDGEIKFWDILNGDIGISKNISPDTKITSLTELTNGELAIGLENGQIKIINRFLVQKKAIEAHKGSVNALVGMADGRLASAGEDGKIKIWGKGYSLEKQYTQSNSFAVQDLIELETGDRKLLSLCKDGTIQLWRIKKDEKSKGVVKADFKIEQAQKFIELLDKNPRTIAVSTSLGEIKIYDRKKGRLLCNYNEDTGKIKTLEIISEGITASGTNKGIITIWDFGYSNKKRYRSKNVKIAKEIKTEEQKTIHVQIETKTKFLEGSEIIITEEQVKQEEKQIGVSVLPKLIITEEDHKSLSQKIDQLKQKRLEKYKEQERYNENLYIPLQASNIPYSESTFDLEEKIKEFIEDKDLKELILFAQGGSGKTLFSKRLEHDLWNKFKSEKDIIPLYISLPSLESYKERAIEETLENYGFTEKQIEILKQNNKFLFILDGYDELLDYPNLYEENELNEWNAKTIITCRQEYFTKFSKGHQSYLYPLKENGILEYSKVKELYIALFSKFQRQTYIEKYIQQTQTTWHIKDYEYHIISNPALEELAKTPFILKLIVEVLPDLVEKQNQDKELKVGINTIYDTFIENWFLREIEKLETKQDIKLTEEQKHEKKGLFRKYCERLASAMHKKGLTEVEYKKTKNQQNEWAEFFDSSDEEIKWCQRACPIIKSEHENRWRFLHKTLQEYFVTKQTLNIIEEEKKEKNQEKSEKVFRKIIEGMNSQLEELSIIRFRVDSIRENPEYKDILFNIIELSKTDETVSTAATNAITALNAASISFIGMNLAGIKIPGADLSGSNFSKSNLQGADLRRVKFEKSILSSTDLRLSQMEDVEFGERSYLQLCAGVDCVTYSPDGTSVAIIIGHKTIMLWDAETWQHLYTLAGHIKKLTNVIYSPDGTIVAAGSQDNKVVLWEVKTGKHLFTFARDKDGPSHLRYNTCGITYSPDGTTIAKGNKNGMVSLWDVETGNYSSFFTGYAEEIHNVIYNPDGTTIAVAVGNGKVMLWDAKTKKHITTLFGQMGHFYVIAFSPDRTTIATASLKKVEFWDIKTGNYLFALPENTDSISSTMYSPDGRTFAVGNGKVVNLWDTKTGDYFSSFLGHTSSINSITYSPDGTILATGGADGTVRIWKMKTEQSLFTLTGHIGSVLGHAGSIRSFMYSPDGKYLATATGDGTVIFWNVKTGQHISPFAGDTDIALSVTYSPNGKILATISNDNIVILRDVETGEKITNLRCHTKQGRAGIVTSVIYSPDGESIVTVSNKEVKLYDVKTGKEIFSDSEYISSITSVAYSPDGESIAIGYYNKTVKILDTRTGKLLSLIAEDEGAERGTLLNLILGPPDLNGERIVAYNPDGTNIAIGSDKGVKLYDVKTSKALSNNIIGYNNRVRSLAYSPDGEILAMGSDKIIRLWDTKNGNQLCGLHGHTDFITSVAYSPDGKTLTTRSEDGMVAFWDLRPLSDGLDPILIFNIASSPALFLEGAMIDGVRGLSVDNYTLLKQRGAKGEPEDAVNLSPFPAQLQPKEDLDFKTPENIPQEINITIDSNQTSIACNNWNNQTNKGEISLSQSFIKFIQTNLNKTQYDDAISVTFNTELTQINQKKLNDKKYSIEIDEEEFKDFEVNTLLHSWINTSKEKLLNYKTALESYWQYLIEQNYKDKEAHQEGVESYLAILDYVINNHEALGGVIDNTEVLLTIEAIKGSKIEMIDDKYIADIKILAAA